MQERFNGLIDVSCGVDICLAVCHVSVECGMYLLWYLLCAYVLWYKVSCVHANSLAGMSCGASISCGVTPRDTMMFGKRYGMSYRYLLRVSTFTDVFIPYI